jgi:uncharacterized protein YvpB
MTVLRNRYLLCLLSILLLSLSACTSLAGQAAGIPEKSPLASEPVSQASKSVSQAALAVTPTPLSPSATVEATLPAPAETGSPVPTETAVLPAVTATAEPGIPAEYYIYGMYSHKQYFPLGCETSAAVDWAGWFGVSINEYEFQTSLPLSDNPDLGFVGDVYGPWGQVPPYAYGVHAEPVAALLREYGLDAQAQKNYTLDEIKSQISQNRPVIAWVIGNMVGGIPHEYTDSQGNTAIVAAYEHVVIVIGYNEYYIRYLNNGWMYEIPIEYFENSWGVLENMVVFMGSEETSPSPAAE